MHCSDIQKEEKNKIMHNPRPCEGAEGGEACFALIIRLVRHGDQSTWGRYEEEDEEEEEEGEEEGEATSCQ